MLKKGRNWRYVRFRNYQTLLVINLKDNAVAVIQEPRDEDETEKNSLDMSYLHKLDEDGICKISGNFRNIYTILIDDFQAHVKKILKCPVEQVTGLWFPLSDTTITVEKRYAGAMKVNIEMSKPHEYLLTRELPAVKTERFNPEMKVCERDGYIDIYCDKQVTYPDGTQNKFHCHSVCIKPDEPMPRLYVEYKYFSKDVLWEASALEGGAAYEITKDGCTMSRIKSMDRIGEYHDYNIQFESALTPKDYVYHYEFYPPEPVDIADIPVTDSGTFNGVREMYLHYKDEAGIRKAIEEYPAVKSAWWERTKPRLLGKAEQWIKENITGV